MAEIPGSPNKIQIESLQFRAGVSESAGQNMGAAINYLLGLVTPVGSIIPSMLTEAVFQAQTSTGWILADGRAVPGSEYATLSGFGSVPDLRGVALRGKNNGRSEATGNPDGDSALGTYQADMFASHAHTLSNNGPFQRYPSEPGRGDGDDGDDYETNPQTPSVDNSGGNETRMRNVTVNFMIRIN